MAPYFYPGFPVYLSSQTLRYFHLANFTTVFCHPPQCVIVSLDIVFMKIHSCYVYSNVNWPGKLLLEIIRLLNFNVNFLARLWRQWSAFYYIVHRIFFDFCNCIIFCENNYFHGEAIPTYGTSGEVGCLPVSMTNVNDVMWLFYFHSMETLRYMWLHIMVSWIVLRHCWLAEKHLCHCAIKWVFLSMFSGYICVT